MKINIILSILFLSVLFYGSIEYSHGIVELTKLNGEGCVCHNISPDLNVNVWIEGPDSVEVNQTVQYTVYLTGGPSAAGGYNAAARSGILFPADSSSKKIDLELTHSYAKLFPGDTVSWQINYTAPSSIQWDTLYSVAQSVNNDGIPNNSDRWNFSPNFPIKIVPFVPVEFTAFSAVIEDNAVRLIWSTASETNNSGFEIERKGTGWEKIGFIKGQNTTVQQSDYYFTDTNPLKGISYYRLKQIDFNGDFSYSEILTVNAELLINNYSLEQNYPNPFNPVTRIRYSIPELKEGTEVSLKVYDLTGKEIAILVNEKKPAGTYEVEFNGASIASGVYLYTIYAGTFSETKKLILMK